MGNYIHASRDASSSKEPEESPIGLESIKQTRAELDQFVKQASETVERGHRIQRKVHELIKDREEQEQLINKLQVDHHAKSTEHVHLKNEIDSAQHAYHQNLQRVTTDLEEVQEKNEELQRLIESFKVKLQKETDNREKAEKDREKAEKDLVKLKKVIDPMKEMERKSQVIAPGSLTHENISSSFKNTFDDRRRLKQMNIVDPVERGVFLCSLSKIAYKLCAEQIIEIASDELRRLHMAPDHQVTVDSPNDEYSTMRSRLDAYSTLLTISGAKKQSDPPQSIIDKMMNESILRKFVEADSATNEYTIAVVNDVVKSCWQMVTICPPMSLGLEPSSDEDQFDRKHPTGEDPDSEFEDILQSPGRKLELVRPVLFYSPHGTYKKKGLVAIVSADKNTDATTTGTPTNPEDSSNHSSDNTDSIVDKPLSDDVTQHGGRKEETQKKFEQEKSNTATPTIKESEKNGDEAEGSLSMTKLDNGATMKCSQVVVESPIEQTPIKLSPRSHEGASNYHATGHKGEDESQVGLHELVGSSTPADDTRQISSSGIKYPQMRETQVTESDKSTRGDFTNKEDNTIAISENSASDLTTSLLMTISDGTESIILDEYTGNSDEIKQQNVSTPGKEGESSASKEVDASSPSDTVCDENKKSVISSSSAINSSDERPQEESDTETSTIKEQLKPHDQQIEEEEEEVSLKENPLSKPLEEPVKKKNSEKQGDLNEGTNTSTLISTGGLKSQPHVEHNNSTSVKKSDGTITSMVHVPPHTTTFAPKTKDTVYDEQGDSDKSTESTINKSEKSSHESDTGDEDNKESAGVDETPVKEKPKPSAPPTSTSNSNIGATPMTSSPPHQTDSASNSKKKGKNKGKKKNKQQNGGRSSGQTPLSEADLVISNKMTS